MKLTREVCFENLTPHTSASRRGDRVPMSLRGSETTEAISKCIENKEVAALSSVARNDKQEL